MPDETEIRPGGEDHAGDAHGERAGQPSPLQGRAAFIKNWDWQLVASLNRGSCNRGKALHGNNSETHERVRQRWDERRPRELTLGDSKTGGRTSAFCILLSALIRGLALILKPGGKL